MGFRFNCYNPEYLRDYVDKTSFDSTVKVFFIINFQEANKICENIWRRKKV